MTEDKRFELIPMSNKNDIWYGLFDNLEEEYVTDKLWGGSEKVCDKLNELYDENEQLKQFKENVIKWVDSQMKFNGKKYIETEDDHFKSENIDLHNFKVSVGID